MCILTSINIPCNCRPATVQMPNLALIEMKRITAVFSSNANSRCWFYWQLCHKQQSVRGHEGNFYKTYACCCLINLVCTVLALGLADQLTLFCLFCNDKYGLRIRCPCRCISDQCVPERSLWDLASLLWYAPWTICPWTMCPNPKHKHQDNSSAALRACCALWSALGPWLWCYMFGTVCAVPLIVSPVFI